MSRAAEAEKARMAPRSPPNLTVRTRTPDGPLTARHTVPTGFSAVPPPGPATPVTATVTSTPARARRPSAIAAATASLTAP
ncbi:MAG: hypothetical protein R2708_25465 [Vicinamibacterales bacterium]